jgi:F-type H+-transporting ATPase subunit epsilon
MTKVISNTFNTRIITPESVIFEGDTVSLVAPGELGYLGILHDHAPLVTTLTQGKLKLKLPENREKTYTIGKGFLEVTANKVTILAEDIVAI